MPRTVDLPQPAIGDVQEFDVLAITADADDEPSYQTVSASLLAVSEHAYFFFEEGFEPERADLDAAVAAFEDRVWPVVTGAFGPPPTPGVDGDERITILHADLGQAIGGYISDSDTYPRAVSPHSNQRETIYMNTLAATPGSPTYVFILAHELQHLSHIELDRDEAAWVNEGLSEFAAALVSGGTGSFGAFLDRPDTQLNAWEDVGGSARHYQASSLFFCIRVRPDGRRGSRAGRSAGERHRGSGGVPEPDRRDADGCPTHRRLDGRELRGRALRPVRLRQAEREPADRVRSQGVGEQAGQSILLALPGFPRQARTRFVYAFCGSAASEAVTISFITPAMLQD